MQGTKTVVVEQKVSYKIDQAPKKMSFDAVIGADVFGYYTAPNHFIVGIGASFIPQRKNFIATLNIGAQQIKTVGTGDRQEYTQFTLLNLHLVKMMSVFVFAGFDFMPSVSVLFGGGLIWSTWLLKDDHNDQHYNGSVINCIGLGKDIVTPMNPFFYASVKWKPLRFLHIAITFNYIMSGNIIYNKNNSYAISVSRMTLCVGVFLNIPFANNSFCIGGGFIGGGASKKISEVSIQL